MKKNNYGVLVLLEIAATVWAIWKFSNMSPKTKRKLKSKIGETGSNLKESIDEIESIVIKKYNRTTDSVKNQVNKATGYKFVSKVISYLRAQSLSPNF